MPTYQYTCRDCGHTFDVVQSMRDEPLAVCPECGGSLRKVFAAPAIAFKGSGFYTTDHGKKGPPKEGEKKEGEKKESTAPAKGAGEKADAKGSSSTSKGDTTGASSTKEAS